MFLPALPFLACIGLPGPILVKETAGAPAITSLFQAGGRKRKGQGQRVFARAFTNGFCFYLIVASSCRGAREFTDALLSSVVCVSVPAGFGEGLLLGNQQCLPHSHFSLVVFMAQHATYPNYCYCSCLIISSSHKHVWMVLRSGNIHRFLRLFSLRSAGDSGLPASLAQPLQWWFTSHPPLLVLFQGDCQTREEAVALGVGLCNNGFMHHGNLPLPFSPASRGSLSC